MRHKKSRNRKVEKARQAELRIQGIGGAGDGYGELNDERIYVPRTVPGDHVLASLVGQKATSFELLSPGPDRIAADCPHYDECGGCQLLHVKEAAYRAHKLDVLKQTLVRAGIEVPEVAAIWCTAQGRRRATLRARGKKDGALLGYQRAASHKLINIDVCLVMEPELEQALPVIRSLANGFLAPGEEALFRLTRFENGLEVSIEMDTDLYEKKRLEILHVLGNALQHHTFTGITVNGEPALRAASPSLSFAGLKVSPPHDAFLQPSIEGEKVLTDLVLNHSPDKKGGRAIDLFSGCGTYALPLSRHLDVMAFESDQGQVDAIEAACRINLIDNVTATRRDLFREPLGDLELRKVDYAVLNPPRAGAKDQVAQLALSSVPQITYVSCNPGTLARDGAELLRGGYKLASLTLVDQFVYAAHAECVAVFSRLS